MKKAGPAASSPPPILDRTFHFAVAVVKLCQQLDERPGVGRVLMPQILRAGTSIVANIEEAQAGQSRADFISKMAIALKEARETHVRLRILESSGVGPASGLLPLLQEVDEIKRVIGAIIIATRRDETAA